MLDSTPPSARGTSCEEPGTSHWFEDELVRVPLPLGGDRGRCEPTYVEIRVTYDHMMRPLGLRPGALLHTLTLQPRQCVYLGHRERSGSPESVQTAFTRTLAQVHGARGSGISDALGWGRGRGSTGAANSGGFVSLPFVGTECRSSSTGGTSRRALSVHASAQSFGRSVHRASARIHAARALVVRPCDHTDDDDGFAVINEHDVAVTCLVRRVVQQYGVTTRVHEVAYRVGPSSPSGRARRSGDWRALDDDERGTSEVVREALRGLWARLPRVGEEVESSRPFTLPGDELVIDTEPLRGGAVEPSPVAANDGRWSRCHVEGLDA